MNKGIGRKEMEVKYCVRCGREVDAKAAVCPHCGAALPTLEEVNRTREKELNKAGTPVCG